MNCHLDVDSAELREAIGWFVYEGGVSRRMEKGEPAGSAALSFRAPYLAISNADFGYLYRASASGDWPNEVVIDAGYLTKVTASILGGDRTSVRVEDGHLYFGGWAGIPCWCRTTRAYLRPREANSQLLERLYLRLTNSDGALDARDLLDSVRNAEEEQARRIRDAVELLAPLGIAWWDLYRASESAARYQGLFHSEDAVSSRGDDKPRHQE